MKKLKNQKGMTLVEVVLLIMLIGFCVPPILMAFAGMQRQSLNTIPLTVASHLAQDVMEEYIYDKSFDAVVDQAVTAFAAPQADYQYLINVDYVEAADLNTSVAGPTSYKKVEVVVSNTLIPDITVRMLGLVTD